MKRLSLINSLALMLSVGLQNVYAQAQSPAAPAAEASSSTPSEKPNDLSTYERDNHLLLAAKPTEAQWLETPNEKIVALYKAGETQKTKGTLLLLHTSESPQLWPAPLENLRANLPRYGWETMAVPLPQKSRPNPNNDSTQGDNNSVKDSTPTTDKTKTRAPREQLIAERINAAMLDINKKNQNNNNLVVLVDNSSAADSLAALYKTVSASTTKNNINGPLQVLILVNLQAQEPLTQTQLAAIFSVADLPIMDVFFEPDDEIQSEMRRLHNAEAMRKNVKYYQQLVLPPEHLLNASNKLSFWQEKVRGFMEKYTEIQKSVR
jgi:Protein of unknown function (DUF3530)